MMKKIQVNRNDNSWFYDEIRREGCKGRFPASRICVDEYLVKHVSIGITNNCNLNCSYCYKSIHSDKKLLEIPLNVLTNFLDKLININMGENHLETVQLIGGEPTLYRNFIELCQYLKKKNIVIRVSTNGTNTKVLQSEELKEIYQSHTMEFRISLDNIDPASNKELRGGNFKIIEENIRFLVVNGANISVKSVITRKNIDKIQDILFYLDGLGVKNFSYSTLYHLGYASDDKFYNENYVSDLEVFEAFLKIMKNEPRFVPMLKSNIIFHTLEALFIKKPPYFFTKFYLYMNYDGNIYVQDQLIYEEFKLGNVYDDPDVEYLCSELRKMKIKYELMKEECISCDYFPFCTKGNYGELYQFDQHLNKAFPTCKDMKNLITFFIENADISKQFLIHLFR
ncbi:radical SAM/SPASM domain-containing protein [[Clostridium] polysaccharolyticum]|uniref:Radical SAM additional 4Fe4S-binding SPASM domain-containing protein n=1 Tax=[Clostridium] polysaccharolyticum TaxID=29364 RepID=A0A1I0EJF0_9FIRM|nr:radical SAM protein [[Clostridium] polysaccharolyticum]SET45476.1 radical SAM additional 4Fe4S-binding SPASM domain-containing protein [[Clostridium] polysaccharolyticum]